MDGKSREKNEKSRRRSKDGEKKERVSKEGRSKSSDKLSKPSKLKSAAAAVLATTKASKEEDRKARRRERGTKPSSRSASSDLVGIIAGTKARGAMDENRDRSPERSARRARKDGDVRSSASSSKLPDKKKISKSTGDLVGMSGTNARGAMDESRDRGERSARRARKDGDVRSSRRTKDKESKERDGKDGDKEKRSRDRKIKRSNSNDTAGSRSLSPPRSRKEDKNKTISSRSRDRKLKRKDSHDTANSRSLSPVRSSNRGTNPSKNMAFHQSVSVLPSKDKYMASKYGQSGDTKNAAFCRSATTAVPASKDQYMAAKYGQSGDKTTSSSKVGREDAAFRASAPPRVSASRDELIAAKYGQSTATKDPTSSSERNDKTASLRRSATTAAPASRDQYMAAKYGQSTATKDPTIPDDLPSSSKRRERKDEDREKKDSRDRPSERSSRDKKKESFKDDSEKSSSKRRERKDEDREKKDSRDKPSERSSRDKRKESFEDDSEKGSKDSRSHSPVIMNGASACANVPNKQLEIEIRTLLEAGTQQEVLYAMFPPPLVDRVIATERALKKKMAQNAFDGSALNEESMLRLKLAGVDLANVEGWLGCSDPFFAMESPMKGLDGTTLWQNMVRSKHIDSNLNPWWDPIDVNVDLLCQLDLDKEIRICIYDWEESGIHNPMGSFLTTVNELKKGCAQKDGAQYKIEHTFKAEQDGKDFGKIVVLEADIKTPITTTAHHEKRRERENIDECSQIRLTLRGESLAGMNRWGGKADVFWQAETPIQGADGSIIWQSIHRSEHIIEDLNPLWSAAEINIDNFCRLDLDRPIRFSFFDWEKSNIHQPMGYFLTNVNRLLSSKQTTAEDKSKAFITRSEDGEEFGKIFVVDVELGRGSPIVGTKRCDKSSALSLTLEGVDMAKMNGLLGACDPFYCIETPTIYPDGVRWQRFYGSDFINNTLNPKWKPASLALDELCKCDIDAPIRFAFFDQEDNGKHQPMGHFTTNVRRLLHSKASKNDDGQWDMTKALICKSDAGKEYGKVVVVDVEVERR